MRAAAIAGISIVAVLSVVLIIFLIMLSIGGSNLREIEYCNNWSANIDRQEAQLNIFSDVDALNAEIADYNRQCAY